MKEERRNGQSTFHDLFKTTNQLDEEIREEIKTLRVIQFQRHDDN